MNLVKKGNNQPQAAKFFLSS